MAPTYATQPFSLVPSPAYANKQVGVEGDVFDECATLMSCVHNMLLRGLNAIYLQAPHVAPADEHDFLRFAGIWSGLLHEHHMGEESGFFPDVDAMTGEKDVMEANVEQHDAFREPLNAFAAYVDACAAGKARYDGKKIVGLIDAFGPDLTRHLADEIPSIQALRTYGPEKMANLRASLTQEGQRQMRELGLMKLAVAYSMIDVHYEHDTHARFPPAPAVVSFIIHYIIWWFTTPTTRFGACDRQGNLKPLYAVPT